MNKRVFVLDNYDSFTYNLIQYIGSLGADPIVRRNDKVTSAEVAALKPDALVISPGPGRPEDAGVSMELVRSLQGVLPILGVCLGHQCIGQVYGGKIIRARHIMHGKVSLVTYEGDNVIFRGIENPFQATRYHSLVIDSQSVPKDLVVIAHSDDQEIMAVRHTRFAIWGVQFHPESILTGFGIKIIENFLQVTGGTL